MNVMQAYPAVTGKDGVTWFRPVRIPGTDVSQWGWTFLPDQAHEDYMCQACFGHPSRCECEPVDRIWSDPPTTT